MMVDLLTKMHGSNEFDWLFKSVYHNGCHDPEINGPWVCGTWIPSNVGVDSVCQHTVTIIEAMEVV